MARKVFFSFHYERDIWRVSQIRNHWVTKPNIQEAGYIDAAAWETVKRQGDIAIKHWINSQLEGTSVTVVLIGAETSFRDWVIYEIEKSRDRGNGLLGIYINNLKDSRGFTDFIGYNPFDRVQTSLGLYPMSLSRLVPVFDWVNDNGYKNFAAWVETAARQAGK